jgi:hypothetical protein
LGSYIGTIFSILLAIVVNKYFGIPINSTADQGILLYLNNNLRELAELASE